MTRPDEIELDDDDLAELSAIGAEMRRNGECYLSQIHYEQEIRRLEQKLLDWSKALAKAKLSSSDPRVERATKIMDQLTVELCSCRSLFLKSWRPDRRYSN